MKRITKNDLQAAVNLINRITGNNQEPYRREAEGLRANVGNYHLSGAYGGWALEQMVNESGGVRDVFQSGHMTARELFDRIHAFRCGFETATKKD